MEDENFIISWDEKSGQINSVVLYGKELLAKETVYGSELYVNGKPLKLRPAREGLQETFVAAMHPKLSRLKGEGFINHFSGWGLVLVRSMGYRPYMKHNCFGISYSIRREQAETTCPCPGPGGPVLEAPLWVDTFSLMNLNWEFWGEDTRMIFPSSHSSGPTDEFGHAGYENDTPENCKKFMKNVWRRIYPGVMAIHGGVFYNIKTGEWLAITCRRPNVGYILNIENAGRGVGYDFTLHTMFNLGDSIRMPEIKIYYGKNHDEMMSWMAEYITFYYEEPPAWVFRTMWGHGIGWNNKLTWAKQADYWEEEIGKGMYSGVSYCLVTNRPVCSDTSPISYEPDPNHGTIEEFKKMCLKMKEKDIPVLIWMSHAGLLQGSYDFDDDWFIRGIDGRTCASWGSENGGMLHVNPGHPGYIEYTKKWIRFYIKECGAKGIFFDCLGWAFPPDFKPRAFMRYPGDTNLMVIKFMEEVYSCIKECDAEGVMLGEGAPLDGPVNIFSINSNPIRGIDGYGPRDFFLQLNKYSDKKIVIDQGPDFSPASGMCKASNQGGMEECNRYMNKLLKEKGGRDAFIHLPGDLSIIEKLLIVPYAEGEICKTIKLPEPWNSVKKLVNEVTGNVLNCGENGSYTEVAPGIYNMKE